MEAEAVTTLGIENSKVETQRFFTSVQCTYDRVREKLGIPRGSLIRYLNG
jgi:hypothetical protein